jgi:hypothetical protein
MNYKGNEPYLVPGEFSGDFPADAEVRSALDFYRRAYAAMDGRGPAAEALPISEKPETTYK